MNKYELAAIITLNDLENTPIKLSTKQQKNLFGFAPFGRKTVNFDCNNQGTARLSFWTDGTNRETVRLSFDEVCQLINDKKVFKW